MNTLIIILFSMLSVAANELKWVDIQIDAIKPSRIGISKANVNSTKNPFIFLKVEKIVSDDTSIKKTIKVPSTPSIVKKTSKTLVLDAIINRSALINGKWYKHNDKVGKYTMNIVNTKSVILTYKRTKLLLSTVSKSKNLNFKIN